MTGPGAGVGAAGVPQPVLVRGDGTAELIGAFGTAVGLVARVELESTRHLIAPGDTLRIGERLF